MTRGRNSGREEVRKEKRDRSIGTLDRSMGDDLLIQEAILSLPPTLILFSLLQVNPLTKSFILSTIPNVIRDSSCRKKITKMSFSLSLARKLEIDLCAWINIHTNMRKKGRKYYCRERRILTWFISILVLCLSWFMEKEDNLLLPLAPHIWQLVEGERDGRERERDKLPTSLIHSSIVWFLTPTISVTIPTIVVSKWMIVYILFPLRLSTWEWGEGEGEGAYNFRSMTHDLTFRMNESSCEGKKKEERKPTRSIRLILSNFSSLP